jgi:DNA repair protein RadA/Sms
MEESRTTSSRATAATAPAARVIKLSEVQQNADERWPSGLPEFDRALGGGLVPGGVTLIGGDPGIGKSTLTLQAIAALSANKTALYVSGEESPAQVAARGARLGLSLSAINMLAETSLESIVQQIALLSPQVVVIDSIQTLYSELFSSAPGSVVQVRECAAELTRLAKRTGMATILVGHVTKDGAIAGPRVLEHLVDTVIYFEGEPGSNVRIIRALKNRYGAANEIGVFAMLEDGLRGVNNPSALFLARGQEVSPGNAVFAAIEGSRPLLVQVQALVDRTGGTPRRVCTGFDSQRLAMLLAVMNRHLGCQLGGFDVFINIVGGLRISEPAADLAIVAAIWSSLSGVAIAADVVIFGELGLGGEVRPVIGSALRVVEADKLGFSKVIGPPVNRQARGRVDESFLQPVSRLDAAIAAIRDSLVSNR